MRLSDALRNKALVDLDDALRGRTYSKDEVMRGEPVKFEAGQVVRVVVAGAGGDTYLVQSMYPDGGLYMRPLFESRAQSVGVNPKHWLVELLSPAPRAGDTWTSGESVARVELDDSGVSSYTRLRIVSEGGPFVGDVVAVARRLWEGGYRWAGATHGKPVVRRSDVRMVRDEAEKWIERGMLAQDAASRASVGATPLDADPTQLSHEEALPLRVRNGEPAPRDIAKGETIEVEMTLGQALAVAGHPWCGSFLRQAREMQNEIDATVRHVVAYFGCSTEDATTAVRRVCEAVPAPWSHALPMIRSGDSVLFAMVRERLVALEKDRSERAKYGGQQVALLPGITPIERTPDGGHRIASDRRLSGRVAASALSQAVNSLSDDQLPRAGDVWSNGVTIVELRECPQGLGMHVAQSDVRWPMLFIGDARSMAEFLIDQGYKRRDPPPRHGDIYKNATQTIRLLVCADGDLRTQIVESSLPEMKRSVARFPQDMMAEYLRERGYVRVEAERPAGEPPARWTGERLRAEAQQLGIDPLPGETDEQLRDRVTAMVRRPWKALYPSDVADRVRECITQCVERGDSVGDAARNIQRAIDSTRADRATGDDLRKLAEVHGVPELRAGMVVRWDRGARPWFGHVEQASASGALIQWSGVGHRSYTAGCVRDYLSESWRIVDPDIRPIAAIADAVAAVFAQPDRATSRKYVDLACAQLRGEPFAQAIRAVLVAACERSEGWPHDAQPAYMILRIVEGAREHERQRSRVARGARSLPDDQLTRIAIAVTAARADTAWSPYLARVYERARAAR